MRLSKMQFLFAPHPGKLLACDFLAESDQLSLASKSKWQPSMPTCAPPLSITVRATANSRPKDDKATNSVHLLTSCSEFFCHRSEWRNCHRSDLGI